VASPGQEDQLVEVGAVDGHRHGLAEAHIAEDLADDRVGMDLVERQGNIGAQLSVHHLDGVAALGRAVFEQGVVDQKQVQAGDGQVA